MQATQMKIYPQKQNDSPVPQGRRDGLKSLEYGSKKPSRRWLDVNYADVFSKALEDFALFSAFKLGLTDDDSYSFERFQEKIFRDKIVEHQTKEHNDKSKLFYWIKIKALDEIQEMLKENPDLITQRDVAGATPIHSAYLFEHYDIAHWLVERYPHEALLPYSDEISPAVMEELPEENGYGPNMMPYTGENILHMVIVRRNRAEVRWILDFYQDHKHTVPGGLTKLLTSNANGMFFDTRGDFSFGGYPLQFAVCANDTEIFDVVLAFASTIDFSTLDLSAKSEKKGRKMSTKVTNNNGNSEQLRLTNAFGGNERSDHNPGNDGVSETRSENKTYRTDTNFGSNVIFMRDSYGNTALHLCVMHCLHDMYEHVYKTAKAIITRELKIHYAKESLRANIGDVIRMYMFDVTNAADTEPVSFTIEPRPVRLPKLSKFDDWLAKETRIKLEERLVLALNVDLHSPLTLASSQIVSTKNETASNQNEKKVKMLEFLLSHLKQTLWTFGPIHCSLLNLEGVEIKYAREEYPEIKSTKTALYSAIEWICRNDADKAITIPEIKKIIEIKWERFGYPKFLVSLFINCMVCIIITLILIFVNSTPTSKPNYPVEWVVNFLYAILVVIFLLMFVSEISFLVLHTRSYFNAQGVVRFSKRCRWFKMTSFAIFCILKTNASYHGRTNDYINNDPLGPYYNPQDFVGIKICLAVCVLFSWMHMYYFLMGFDKTGPFILTIFRIVSKDVPYFINFYFIVVIAFACVLSMLSNSGDYHAHYGFYIFLQAIYTLIQFTVGVDTTHNLIGLENVPADLQWLTDILLTAYNAIVAIIMLNLLIAMISNTYAEYTSYNDSLLLMEKYNIMHAMELSMTHNELQSYRRKFAIEQPANDNDDDEFFSAESVKLNSPLEGVDLSVDNGPAFTPAKNGVQTGLSLRKLGGSKQNVTSNASPDVRANTDYNNVSQQNNSHLDTVVAVKKPLKNKYSFEMQDTNTEWWENNKGNQALTQAEIDKNNQDAIVKAVLAAMDINSEKSNVLMNRQFQELIQTQSMQNTPGANTTPGGTQIFRPTSKNSGIRASLGNINSNISLGDNMFDKPAVKSTVMSTLFIIDPQNDFHPEGGGQEFIPDPNFPIESGKMKRNPMYHKAGSLAVQGANEDSERIAKMIHENKANIREIFVSLDSHYPTHIAHAMFWLNADGTVQPPVFTRIMHSDVKNGVWRPKDPEQLEWCLEYTKMLERKGRMVLTIWPEHCIVGSRGHSVVPVINEALKDWAHHSGRPITYIMKGQNCRTEMYSAIEAEVEDPLDASTGLNAELVDMLKISDQLILCGEAMSHCVNFTLRDIVKHWHGDISKVVLLKDGASPVYMCEKDVEDLLLFVKKQGVTLSTCAEVFNAPKV